MKALKFVTFQCLAGRRDSFSGADEIEIDATDNDDGRGHTIRLQEFDDGLSEKSCFRPSK
jgi:hypothetical protein